MTRRYFREWVKMQPFLEKSKVLYGKVLDEYSHDFPNDTKTISVYQQWLGEILDVREEDTDVPIWMVDKELKAWYDGLRGSRTHLEK